MNKEDKLRFIRYTKGYIPPIDNENNETNENKKLGNINKIDINTNILITGIISNKSDTRKIETKYNK